MGPIMPESGGFFSSLLLYLLSITSFSYFCLNVYSIRKHVQTLDNILYPYMIFGAYTVGFFLNKPELDDNPSLISLNGLSYTYLYGF